MAVDAAKKLEAEGKKVRQPPAVLGVRRCRAGRLLRLTSSCWVLCLVPAARRRRRRSDALPGGMQLTHLTRALSLRPQVRVVSMPVWELFEEQPESYRNSVLPPEVTARVSVEAGSTYGWEKWVGQKGRSIGINEFGASAPGPLLYEKFGITVDAVVEAAKQSMAA